MKRDATNRVVFHHSLASISDAETIRQWHLARGFDDIGYHFVLLKNGDTQPGRDPRSVGAHAAGKNHDSIGICFEGDFRVEDPTEEQYVSACKLYHNLCRAYSKTLSIEYHRVSDNPCPGPLLDKKKLEKYCRDAVT
jgi:N-acetylmuramoyl-L-alanine amidase